MLQSVLILETEMTKADFRQFVFEMIHKITLFIETVSLEAVVNRFTNLTLYYSMIF